MRRIEACRDILEDIQPATVRAICYLVVVAGLMESKALAPSRRSIVP
jgi:hypothetical protein